MLLRCCQGQNRASGFTLVDVLLAITVVGIITAGALNQGLVQRLRANTRSAVSELKALRELADQHYLLNGQAPTIGQLRTMYHNRNHKTVVGRWVVLDGKSLSLPEDGIRGYHPAYVICSTFRIPNADYIYVMEGHQPEFAGVGTDPLGVGQCGPAAWAYAEGVDPYQPEPEVLRPSVTVYKAEPLPTVKPRLLEEPKVEEVDVCALDRRCPCQSTWTNRGEYEDCVKDVARECNESGRIGQDVRDLWLAEARASICGL